MIKLFFIIIYINILVIRARNANEFYTFKDAKATSVYIALNNDLEKHSARRAYQIGPSYWCSAGNHPDTDFVSWTGELYDVAKISQLEVYWEYAPKEVEISTSLTGDDFNVVMPFKETFENKPSYKEIFKLDVPEYTKFIRLTLRGSINTYFGIRDIHIIGTGSPLFMIKSGISSTLGEMCLQVEEGYFENKTRVVLDYCTHALAAADGRELWRQDKRGRIVSASSYPEKCLTSSEPSNYGGVIIDDCTDDTNVWEFMGNAQLKTLNDLCLTQRDEYSNKAGMGNLIHAFKVDVKSNGSTVKHEEKYAIDGNLQTYWASLLFPDSNSHYSTLTIDFEKLVHGSRVSIDWEYQAFSYTIDASVDGTTYSELAKNLSNSEHLTVDSFHGSDFKHLRIKMIKPHYLHGKVPGGFIYGIRDIQILGSNLQTVVGDCRAAANTDDARDKYFVSYVSSFEPKLSSRIKTMEDDLHEIVGDVLDELNHLRQYLDETDDCMNEKKDYNTLITSITKREQDLWKRLTSFHCNVNADETSIPGETMTNPAEDCHTIKSNNNNATSGFYWIEPKCAKHPLRVYCDMNSLTSLYICNGNEAAPLPLSHLRTPKLIRYQCASLGLEPLIIKTKHQIDELKKALSLMNIHEKSDSYIPLGYKFNNSHIFKDLLNIYSFSSDYNRKELHENAVGLSMVTGTIETFDLETSEIGAIVCSTNEMGNVVVPVKLACDDVFGKTPKLSGSLNTNIIVECNQDCTNESHLPVYGVDGIYSDYSSICRAAIHSGVIGTTGKFSISIESGLSYYDGNLSNGIQSISYNKSWSGLKDLVNNEPDSTPEHNGPNCKFSLRISPIALKCPIIKTLGSFLQIHEQPKGSLINPLDASGKVSSDPLITAPGDHTSQITKTDETSLQGNSTTSGSSDEVKDRDSNVTHISDQKEPQIPSIDITDVGLLEFDPLIKSESTEVMTMMDALYGIDSKTITSTIESIAAVVSRAKGYLKPLESVTSRQDSVISSLFDKVDLLSDRARVLKDSLEFNKTMYEQLLKDEEEKTIDTSGDLAIDYTKMSFKKTFKIYDTSMVHDGPSNWGYSDMPFEGHPSYIVQSSNIDSELNAEGTFAFIRHYRYYDFQLSVDLLAKYQGSIGIAFRVHDKFNYYLFVMNFHKSNKQLLKVQDGIVTVLATNPDEGYTPMKWSKIDIVTSFSSIHIYHNDKEILRVLDTSFLHGGIALYSRGHNGTFYYDNLKVQTKPYTSIESPKRLSRLREAKCCNFIETFTGNFNDAYDLVGPQHTTAWKFKEMFNGKRMSIHQQNQSSDSLDIGSIIVLKHDYFCMLIPRSTQYHNILPSGRVGYYRFRFLPQCPGGTIGAVLYYECRNNMYLVELNKKELRIRRIKSGVSNVLATVPATFIESKWNVMEIEMSNVITAKVVNHESILTDWLSTADYKVSATLKDVEHNGLRIGLKSSSCNSCYFDHIQVTPTKEYQHVPLNLLQEFTTSNVWKACIENVHILTRISSCKEIHRNLNDTNSCISNFCEPCCLHHTKLLGHYEFQNCLKQCKKNDTIATQYNKLFEVLVNSCTRLQGDAFHHCNEDRRCLRDSCRLCCTSGHKNAMLDSKLKQLEITFCENKC